MSNLKPLVWSRSLTALSPMHEYSIRKDGESTDKYMVKKTRLATQKTETVTGFESIELAKHWCYSEHYKPKMQPYVKPSPTWIDASKKLPTHHQDVIVYRYDGEQSSIEHSLYLDGEAMKGFGNVADEEGFFDDVYYWQPIETKALYEAMLMQLQIKGE